MMIMNYFTVNYLYFDNRITHAGSLAKGSAFAQLRNTISSGSQGLLFPEQKQAVHLVLV
jgi:hypothetical protein